MFNNDILETIRKFVSHDLLQVTDSPIHDQTNLLLFGLDSLKMMRLVHFLEQQFDVMIADEDVNPTNMQSIESIIHLIQHYKNKVVS